MQSILETLNLPVPGAVILRAILVLLASLLTLAVLERRFQALSGFLNEKSTALNLAVARVAVAGTLLWQVHLQDILLSAALDPVLRVPFKIWGGLALRLLAPPGWLTAIYWLFVLSAILMLIGLYGRVASALTAITSLYLLSFLFLYGKVDHVFHHLVCFAAICALFPSADTLSVDAALAAWSSADRGRLLRNSPSLAYGRALRFMWCFVGLAYYFPGLWKLSRGWTHWVSGKTLQDDIALAGQWLPWSALQVWMFRHPLWLSAGAMLVVLFELGFIFLVIFPRLRPVAGVLGLAFHSATILIVRIGFVALETCYVIFFDWTAILSWVSRKLSLGSATVEYDPHCKLCRRTAGTLALFDWTRSLDFVPKSAAAHFSVTAADGRSAAGYEGYKLIAARLPLFWLVRPFMGVPVIQQLGSAIYRRVAGSRTCSVLDETPSVGEHPVAARTSPIAYGASLAGLAAMAILGLFHVDNMWPVSCFPAFDGASTDMVAHLSVQALDHGNVAQDWNLSGDPKLRAEYPRWYWLTFQGMAGKAPQAKAQAVVALWLNHHPELALSEVTISLDIYRLLPPQGERLRVARQKVGEFKPHGE